MSFEEVSPVSGAADTGSVSERSAQRAAIATPRTPRQWAEGSEEPPADVTRLRGASGEDDVVRCGTGWWIVAPGEDPVVPDSFADGFRWRAGASIPPRLWPLSEVLPETPEPPREDPVPPEIYAKHQYNTRQMREPDQLEDLCTCGEWVADWLKHHAEEAAKLHAPVPASQSVPAVPETSTGGADGGEGDEDVQATSEAWTLHTAIAAGIKRGLADFGAELTGCTAAALTGHVISQLREAGLHPEPLPDSETEWGIRIRGEKDAQEIGTEQWAHSVARGHEGYEVVQRRAAGPWIEVTS